MRWIALMVNSIPPTMRRTVLSTSTTDPISTDVNGKVLAKAPARTPSGELNTLSNVCDSLSSRQGRGT